MDVKLGTKTYNEQPSRKAVSESSKSSNLSATDKKQVLGGKGLDQVLNEIADPKYVDPAKVRKPQGKLDKDAFLKLMLTQLKYQDPMNPMQNHEMAAQLAQFSSLEQLTNIDTSIKGLQKTQDPMANYQALNFIGKSVTAETEKIIRGKGDTNHDLRFQLPQGAKDVTVLIKDDTGAVIRTLKATNLKKGENKVAWNGTKEDGFPTYSGTYSFSVQAVSDHGGKFSGRTSFGGTVTGLNYTAEGPILMIGDQKVRLSDVKKIEDPNERAALDLKDQAQKQAPEMIGAAQMGAVNLMAAPAKGGAAAGAAGLALPNQANQAAPQSGLPMAPTAGLPNLAAMLGPQAPHELKMAAVAKPESTKTMSVSQDDGVTPAAEDRPKGNIDMVPMNDNYRNMVSKEANLKE